MISVIIPCYNEERSINFLLQDIKKLRLKDIEIIVVDNGSTDKTRQIVKNFDNVKLLFEKKRGKGYAMKKGAEKAKGEILVFIDGDNSYFAGHILNLAKNIELKNFDIVYGSRFLKGSKTKISFFRLIGNKLFSFLGFLLYRKKIDFLTGLFAIKKNKFFEINPRSSGFEIETEIFKKSVKKGLKISQVPVRYRANNQSKINPLFDGLKILFTLIL